MFNLSLTIYKETGISGHILTGEQHNQPNLIYSKSCVKRPLKNRQNKDLNDKW